MWLIVSFFLWGRLALVCSETSFLPWQESPVLPSFCLSQVTKLNHRTEAAKVYLPKLVSPQPAHCCCCCCWYLVKPLMIRLTPLNNPVELFGKVKFTSISLNANSFLKSSMIQIKTSVGRPRPCSASPGRCEVSETSFQGDLLAADKRARSLLYRSVRGADSRECKHTSVFSVWLQRRKPSRCYKCCMGMWFCVSIWDQV